MNSHADIEVHAHPNFRVYGIKRIIETMDKNGLDVVGLAYLDQTFSTKINSFDGMSDEYKITSKDVWVIERKRDQKSFYLFPSIELNTTDNFHVFLFGEDKPPKERLSVRKTIEYGLANNALVLLNHPFVNVNHMGRSVSKEKEADIEMICKQYSGHIALEWSGYCKNLYWNTTRLIGNKNPNQQAFNLSEKLKKEGYTAPVIADTDLHASTPKALKAMGSVRMRMRRSDLDFSSRESLLESMKQHIFAGSYDNIGSTVSASHLIRFFALSYLKKSFSAREE